MRVFDRSPTRRRKQLDGLSTAHITPDPCTELDKVSGNKGILNRRASVAAKHHDEGSSSDDEVVIISANTTECTRTSRPKIAQMETSTLLTTTASSRNANEAPSSLAHEELVCKEAADHYQPRPSRSRSTKIEDTMIDYSVRPEKTAQKRREVIGRQSMIPITVGSVASDKHSREEKSKSEDEMPAEHKLSESRSRQNATVTFELSYPEKELYQPKKIEDRRDVSQSYLSNSELENRPCNSTSTLCSQTDTLSADSEAPVTTSECLVTAQGIKTNPESSRRATSPLTEGTPFAGDGEPGVNMEPQKRSSHPKKKGRGRSHKNQADRSGKPEAHVEGYSNEGKSLHTDTNDRSGSNIIQVPIQKEAASAVDLRPLALTENSAENSNLQGEVKTQKTLASNLSTISGNGRVMYRVGLSRRTQIAPLLRKIK